MYEKILVPIDLSHEGVGQAMIDVAKKIGGAGLKLTLMHVVEEIPKHAALDLPSGIMDKWAVKARAALEEIARETQVEADIEVRTGSAHQVILAAAEERKFDLIIIASHRPGLQDYLIGSTAARVVRHAQCAVLVDR